MTTGIGIGISTAFASGTPEIIYYLYGTPLAVFNADKGITLNSQYVTEWAPEVGSSSLKFTASSGLQPLYQDRGDGLKEIKFDGVNDILTSAGLASLFTPTGDFTVVLSGKLIGTGYGSCFEVCNTTTGSTGAEPNDQIIDILSNDVSFTSIRKMSGGTYNFTKDAVNSLANQNIRHSLIIKKTGNTYNYIWGTNTYTFTDSSGLTPVAPNTVAIGSRLNAWPANLSLTGIWIYSDINVPIATLKSEMEKKYPTYQGV